MGLEVFESYMEFADWTSCGEFVENNMDFLMGLEFFRE